MIKTTNENLRDDVLAELDSEPRVKSSKIGVIAEDGVVTLTGSVASLAEKWAAEDAAKRVKGVRAIVEELDIDLPSTHQRDDDDIARAVANIIYWDTLLPSTIQATVRDGFVTLSGEVEWQYQRQEAEDTIRRVAGVRGISNLISLRSALTEKDVRTEIRRILHRDAQVDSENVNVSVEGSKVYLSGTVRSWFERNEASRAAWSIKGVTAVQNDIAIA